MAATTPISPIFMGEVPLFHMGEVSLFHMGEVPLFLTGEVYLRMNVSLWQALAKGARAMGNDHPEVYLTPYRGISFARRRTPLGPYPRVMPRVLGGS